MDSKSKLVVESRTGRSTKRLLTLAEAAEYLGRSIWAVRELIWKGSLPCVRFDRRVHLDINDLDRWIEQNKHREAR